MAEGAYYNFDEPCYIHAVDGMTMEDMFKPGFASVVIAEDWH